MSVRNDSRIRRLRRWGQHFLVDTAVLQKIVDYAMLRSGEKVLEVGAGTGNLTAALQRSASKVIAIEKDKVLANLLRRRFRGKSQVEIIEGDVLKISLPTFDKVVCSPPYYISSKLIFLLLKEGFRSMTMTFQKEFASRLVAEPGSADYGRLTVAVQHRADVELLDFIPRKAFRPVPRVDSYIVKIVPRVRTTFVDENYLDRMVRHLFSQRKRTLRGVLKHAMDPAMKSSLEDLVRPSALLEKRIFQLTTSELENLSNCLCSVQRIFKF